MTRWEAWTFGVVQVVVALSGGVYFFMKYLLQTDDPFAVVNHPWQPSILAVHILAAPLGVLMFGMLLRSHVLKKLVSSPHPAGRKSGWTALIGFAAMALSGYLLQVVSSPRSIRVVMVTHVATSVVFLAGYIVHLVLRLLHSPQTSSVECARGVSPTRPTSPT
jgi:hypothetical protein